MSDIIDELKDRIHDDLIREEVYSVLIEAFQDRDCDSLDECYGEDSAFDAALDDINFEVEEEEEDEWIDEDEEDIEEEDE
jgi:hypothetical protein